MTEHSQLVRDIRPRVVGALRLRRVQLAVTLIVALVLVALTVLSSDVWQWPWVWMASIGMVAATVSALASRDSGMSMRIIVPTLDLIAVTALIADPQAPRIVAILAVVPAFWLGVTARGRGIGLVSAVSALLLVVMALRVPGSVEVTLTANAVGAVLVPIALVSTAWFASNYARTIERQQLAILLREQEKLAIAKQRDIDARLLDAIFETARVGLLLLDAEGQVVRVNPTLAQHPALGGIPVDDLLDSARFLELETRREFAPDDAPLARAARGEAFDNVAFWISRPGARFAVTVSSRPLVVDDEFRGTIVSVDDVTTYMRMLEDRDDFVAMVSHELRTPLTSIAGFLELTLDEELPDSLRSWLRIVQRNADRLRALVEDLLVVGEMNRGEVQLVQSRVDLRVLATEAIVTLEHRAHRRGVRLGLADGPPVEVDADPRRIAQVIENLVSNGIKYTQDAGSVEVQIEHDGLDACFRVVDDGPGMPAAEAIRVFERFYRSPDARASGVQGAGLGMWICKTIVEEHGGSIDFDSVVGGGSTASFRLRGSH